MMDGLPYYKSNKLFQAIYKGELEEVIDLVSNRGEDVNQRDHEWAATPLMIACTARHGDNERALAIIQYLIDQGADVNTEIRGGEGLARNVFFFLAYGTLKGAVPLIMSTGRVTILNTGYGYYLESALDYVVPIYECNPHVTKELLEAGAKPDSVTRDGRNVLFAANHPDAIRLLVQYGADVNCVDVHGYTPLHYACKHYRPGVIAALLECGADINLAPSRRGSIYERMTKYIESTPIHKMTPCTFATAMLLLDSNGGRATKEATAGSSMDHRGHNLQ